VKHHEDSDAEEKEKPESGKKKTDETPDPHDTERKHPLQHKWTMYYNPPKDWKPSPILSCDTVEDFWGLFNNLQKASMLDAKANYHLFKDGLKPAWEDPGNKNGGQWTMQLQGKKGDERLDLAWMNTVLAVIGDIMPDSDEICGVVIGSKGKGGGKLALWTRNAGKDEAVLRIGEAFKKVNDSVEAIDYLSHAQSMEMQRSRGTKPQYTL